MAIRLSRRARTTVVLAALAFSAWAVSWTFVRRTQEGIPPGSPAVSPEETAARGARAESLAALADRLLGERRNGAARVAAFAAVEAQDSPATRAVLASALAAWAPTPRPFLPSGIAFPVAVSPNGTTIAAGGTFDRSIRLRAIAEGGFAGEIRGHEAQPVALAWASKASIPRLASADESGGLRVTDIAPGVGSPRTVWARPAKAPGLRSLSWALGDDVLCAGTADGSVLVVDGVSGETRRALGGHDAPVVRLVASADGTRLASGDARGGLRLWDVASGRPLGTTRCDGPFAVPGNGSLVFLGGEEVLRAWDPATGEVRATAVALRGGVRCIVAAPSGRGVLYVGAEAVIKVIEISGERPVFRFNLDSEEAGFPTALALVITADEKRLFWLDSDRAGLWEWSFAAKDRRAIADPAVAAPVEGAEARSLEIADRRIVVRDEGGAVRAVLEGHDRPVATCVRLPDGRIVSTDTAGTRREWDASPDAGAGVTTAAQAERRWGLRVAGEDVVPIPYRELHPSVRGTFTRAVPE